ncbi:MAG: hypothetical protein ABIS15_05045 [Gemmatimonadaceae bacterium]
MKVLLIGLAIAGIAATTPLDAQIVVGQRPTASRNDDINNNSGQWYSVGRDASGYSIYERRTRDNNGNIVIQRARRNSNGSMTIISTRTVRDDRRDNRNCDYTRSTNSIGDILFGRTNDRVCDDEYSREDGGWYQVGRGPNNNSVYERRTRDSNGNLIIQKARRNPDGTMRILSTRRVNSNDKQWKKEQKRHEKEHRKAEKRHEKSHERSDRGTDHDDDDDRGRGRGRGNGR